jgi:hypothetical protein
VKLVRVHDERFLCGLGHVVTGRQREPLADNVLPRDADPGVTRGEAADLLGQAFLPEKFVPEDPVTNVAGAIQQTVVVVQPVHADVVQQAPRPYQFDVACRPGPRVQLPGQSGHDTAVRVDEV